MMKNMFVLHFFSIDFVLFWMCVVVDCDDLAMNAGLSAGGFQSICCCFCSRVFKSYFT